MFRLRYVHKVTQVCKCGRNQYDHSREPRADEKARYPHKGQRVYGEGPFVRFYDGVQTCAGYEPATELVDLPDDMQQIANAAAAWSGSSGNVRKEANGAIVFFPRRGIWHSLIFTPEP